MNCHRFDALGILDQLCALIADATPTGPPVAMGIELTADGMALHSSRIGDLDDLIGFRAPEQWDGFGIAAGGRRIEHGRRAPFDLSVVHLVHRSGASCSRVMDGGEPVSAIDGNDAEGRLVDLCRRTLGVSTPSPTFPVDRLWSTMWLDRVLSERLASDLGTPAPTWAQVCQHHPLGPRPDRVLSSRRRDRRLRTNDWEVLRQDVVANRAVEVGVRADEAAWFDTGSFARHALGLYPPLEDLASDLSYLLPSSVADRIRRAAFDGSAAA